MEIDEVNLGCKNPIHAFILEQGIMFSMAEVAVEVFGEHPLTLGKELRRQRYPRLRIVDNKRLTHLAQLGIKPESTTVVGATLVPLSSLIRMFDDRRRTDLIRKLQEELMYITMREVEDLIVQGESDTALPLAMDAVKKAQSLYWPNEPLLMVPCYLLAAKVNVALKRSIQSEDLLACGSWLLLQDNSDVNKDYLRSKISTLFGRLSICKFSRDLHDVVSLQEQLTVSLKAYAEEIYYKSREFGIYDVRTSIAFYNMSCVFRDENEMDHALAYWDVVIHAWRVALEEVILDIKPTRLLPWGKKEYEGKSRTHLGPKEAIATMHMHEVCDMLQEICKMRSEQDGNQGLAVGEACYVTGLAFQHDKQKMQALEHLQRAHHIAPDLQDFIAKAIQLLLQPPSQPIFNASPVLCRIQVQDSTVDVKLREPSSPVTCKIVSQESSVAVKFSNILLQG